MVVTETQILSNIYPCEKKEEMSILVKTEQSENAQLFHSKRKK